jgi:hypothetical protein
VLDTVLQAKTVLAGVKTLALVLNRVLVACIAAACNFFFLGHLGHMTSLIHHISHHFENRNNKIGIIYLTQALPNNVLHSVLNKI